MYVLSITDDYDNITFTDSRKIENEVNNITLKYLRFSIPSRILLFSLISLMINTLVKHLKTNK